MAEEEREYKFEGFGPATWVECNSSLVKTLTNKIKLPGNFIEACVGDVNGTEVMFYVAGVGSSIFISIGFDQKLQSIVPKILFEW